MLRLLPRLLLVVGIGMTAAACQGDSYPAPRGYYQPAPVGYYQPAPTRYYQPASAYYNNQYYRNDGNATVTVTNRGQNGYRDDVVQQRVPCGSQYYDGYRTRTARC
jgi:hypothetical protein